MSAIHELQRVAQSVEKEGNRALKDGHGKQDSSSISFAATIKDFLTAVNDSQQEAAGKVAAVIQGKSENLVEAMTNLEEAHLSFQLMLEIRNKLLESYQEIQRMQV